MSERLRHVCLAMATIAIVASVYPAWAAGAGPGVPAAITSTAAAATEGNNPHAIPAQTTPGTVWLLVNSHASSCICPQPLAPQQPNQRENLPSMVCLSPYFLGNALDSNHLRASILCRERSKWSLLVTVSIDPFRC